MKSYADFMMVLSPPQDINNLITGFKQQAAHVIGSYENMHSKPYVSIKSLSRQKTFITEPAIAALKEKVKSMPPVSITLDGLDYFTHAFDYKTIYAKIVTDEATAAWFKQLKKHLTIKEFLVPHIAICRNVTLEAFNAVWPQLKSVKCGENFEVTHLTVLSREAFAHSAKWKVYADIAFENKNAVNSLPLKSSIIKNEGIKAVKNQQFSLF